MAGGIKLAPLKTEIKVDIDNFKSDMHKAAAIGVSEAERISKSLSTTAKIGDTLSRTGSSLTKGLTLPIVGVGTALTTMAVDFESKFAKVSTLLDSNVVDFGEYKNELLNASSKSKVAVGEFSEAVYNSISAGVDQTKAIGFTTDAMKLAKGGFTDGAKAVDILTTAINGYGMKTEDVTKISDMLITTQNLGKTTVDELASSMGAVIPVANSVNFGVDELSASYAQLTKNGISTAESGTYLKAMLSELGKSGSVADEALRQLTGKGFADLKKEGTPTADILKQLGDYAQQNGKTLKDMFGSVEAGSAALVLAKGDGTEYNDMLTAMQSSAGATQEAFDKMDATPAEQLKGALNELKNEGIKFGAAFVPVIEKAAGVLGKAADAFSGLSEEQQDNVIKWGMVLAAAGPVLKVVGGGISTFTKLSGVLGGAGKALGVFGSAQTAAAAAAGTAEAAVGTAGLTGSMVGLLGICAPVAAGAAAVGAGLYAVHESSQLAKRGVNEASEDMSLMERIIAKLNGTEVHSREELEKLGIVTKDYGDTVSEEFSKAMDTAREKMVDFNEYLTEISLDGVVTADESSGLISRVNEMCNSAIKTIQSKKAEAQKNLKELFIANDGVIDESEQKVLDSLGKSYDEQQKKVQEHVNAVNEIKKQADEQEGKLNQQQIEQLGKHYEEVSQLELQATAQSKEEMLAAEKDFQSQIMTMNADDASKLLQQKAKERDKQINLDKQKYDEGINQLKAYMSNADETEKANYQKQINDLEDAKNKQVKKEQEKYDKFYDMALTSNKNLEDVLDKHSGKVLSNADLEAKKEFEIMKNRYGNIDKITESGCYNLYNEHSKTWDKVTVKVDSKTGEIVGIQEAFTKETEGATKKMAKSTFDMAQEQQQSYDILGNALEATMDKNGRLVDKNGRTIDSMTQVQSATDGTTSAIVTLNGTPYEIRVNKDGTVVALNEINAAADNAARDRTITFIPNYSESTSAQKWMEHAGISSGHYNGLDNVPYDGYRATLHKGERIMTAQENKTYTEAAYKDDSAKEITVVVQLGVKEISRELVPLVDEGLGKLLGRSKRW